MTGKNAITAAADLLCRNEQHSHFPDETLLSCALSALNSVYADLFCLCRPDEQFEPLWTLDDKIDLPPNILHDGFYTALHICLHRRTAILKRSSGFAGCITISALNASVSRR